jgi:hypothetical protein
MADKVVYSGWEKDADSTTGSLTDSYGGESGSMEDPMDSIRQGNPLPPGILRINGPVPKMPASGTIATAPPAPEKHVAFADYAVESSDGEHTTTTTTLLRAEAVPTKRGRGRPKKGGPILTQEEARTPLTPHQAQIAQKRIDELDSKRAEHVKEQQKKAVEEEIKRREHVLSEEEQEIEALLRKLNTMYRYWPIYKENCPRKGAFTIHTPRQHIVDEIARILGDRSANKAFNSACHIHNLIACGIEYMGREAGIPLKDYSKEVKANIFLFEDTLKELALEYESYLVQGPEMAYISMMAMTAKDVIDKNMAIMAGHAHSRMTQEAQAKFEQEYSHM